MTVKGSWTQSYEMHRKDGSGIDVVSMQMNDSYQSILEAACKEHAPNSFGIKDFVLMSIGLQKRDALDALRSAMPGAFLKDAKHPIAPLMAVIAANEDFPTVIDWIFDQGLDARDPLGPGAEYPWECALEKGSTQTIQQFIDRCGTEILTQRLHSGSRLLPLMTLCGTGHMTEALEILERVPGLAAQKIDLHETIEIDLPGYLDKLNRTAEANTIRSWMSSKSARAALEEIVTTPGVRP